MRIERSGKNITVRYKNKIIQGKYEKISDSIGRVSTVHDSLNSQRKRIFMIFKGKNGTRYLTHNNFIPVVKEVTHRELNNSETKKKDYFYGVRMLRQKYFNAIHPHHEGQRGAYSAYTGVCDVVLDHPFFRTPVHSKKERLVKSTLAHEFSHKLFDEATPEFRRLIRQKLTENADLWLEAVAGFIYFWGQNMLKSKTVFDPFSKTPWRSLIPHLKDINDCDRTEMFSVDLIIDELLAKKTAYIFRPSHASDFMDYLDIKLLDHHEEITQFVNKAIRLTEKYFTLEFVVPETPP